jgi:hypothetical protein
MLRNDRYTYRVTWSEEDEEYVGLSLNEASRASAYRWR